MKKFERVVLLCINAFATDLFLFLAGYCILFLFVPNKNVNKNETIILSMKAQMDVFFKKRKESPKKELENSKMAHSSQTI